MRDTWQNLRAACGLPEMNGYFGRVFNDYDGARSPLNMDFIREHKDLLRFSDELCDAVEKTEALIQADEDLRYAADFLYYAIFLKKEPFRGPYVGDFNAEKLGEYKGMLAMNVLLRNAEKAYTMAEKRGLNLRDVRGNLGSLGSFAREYHHATGRYGLSNVGWNIICVTEYLNTVDCLRFAPAAVEASFRVYDTPDGIVTLCAEDMEFTRDGLYPFESETPAFTAIWREDENTITANPVSRSGRVQEKPVTYRKDQIKLLIGPEDTALEFHIPTADTYTPVNCARSMRRALEYFSEHFPELKPKGFWCYSWLYCPQLPDLMNNCGILKMQKALRLVPVESGPESFRPFVFDVEDDTPLADYPEETSLHRALKKAMLDKKHLCCGGVLMPIREIDDMEKNA